MLQSKDTSSFSELKTYFNPQAFVVDNFLDWVSFFKFKAVCKSFDSLKSKGYSISTLVEILIIMPFVNKDTIYALLRSGISDLSSSAKDSYYRLAKMDTMHWEKFLFKFVQRFLHLVDKKGNNKTRQPSYLILDDTLLAKTGKTMEGISVLWDHVAHRFQLGYRLLQLGLYDGKSFIPVDFSFHREKGKNSERPYGLSKSESASQYKKDRIDISPGKIRHSQLDSSKIEMGIRMISRACKKIKVSYLLMDSWFTCEQMLKCAKEANVKLIGMVKMGKAQYLYKDKELNAGELLQRMCKRAKRCKKLKTSYIQLEVDYKGFPVMLYFSRFGKRGRWNLILTTDLNLSYLEMMKHYQIRWTIEVYFKEAKQYLNLGKCQAEDLDAQAAHVTIAMLQYILLSLKKRFGDYETKGELFNYAEEMIQSLTLGSRIWGFLLELIQAIVEFLNLVIEDFEEFAKNLFNAKKINILIARAME